METTMTPEQAQKFRGEHDNYVRWLSRRKRPELAQIHAADLRARGTVSLYGGPRTKDELINAIVNDRFPVAKLNEAIHVIHHSPGENWSACNWCHPHNGELCECDLGRAAR